MINLTVFLLGLLVSLMTATAAFLVALQEASNPSSSDPEDLADWEKKLVDREDLPEPADS